MQIYNQCSALMCMKRSIYKRLTTKISFYVDFNNFIVFLKCMYKKCVKND